MAKKIAKEPVVKPPPPPPPKEPYSIGEIFTNPYLGTRITEILDDSDKRAGWVWVQSGGRVIVSPNLGIYVWFNELGTRWTTETAALWLVKKRR